MNDLEWDLLYDSTWQEFLSNATSIDLFKCVQTLNYDGITEDSALVQKILNDANIDKSVVVAFYWHQAPRYHYQFKTEADIPSWLKDQHVLIKKLEQLLLSGFYSEGLIYYDPKDDDGENWTNDYLEYDLDRKLPQALEQAINGKEWIDDFQDFDEGLPIKLLEKLYQR